MTHTQTQTDRRPYDARGIDLDCICCKASKNPRGCKARGHYEPTVEEAARSYLRAVAERLERERNPRPVCRVCGTSYCLERRLSGSPLYCD